MLNLKYDKILHLVGAQKTNSPWGFENRLIPALESMGLKVISTDFRQEKDRLPELLLQKADIVLICKGEGISSQLIRSVPCVTALWYAEQIGTHDHYDDLSQFRRNELSFNVESFDYVFSHDQGNLNVYKGLGAKRVAWLSCAAVDLDVNCKINASKQHDVVFIGSKTPRRQKILFELERRGITVYSPNIWDPKKLNQIFNESRIVLNIHLSDLLNTETRIAEVLGAGSFLLSEKISSPDLLTEGKHYVNWSLGNTDELVEKIAYYLSHEMERERIAHEGYCYINEHHTYEKRIETFLDSIDFDLNQRIWPSYELGFLFDSNGQPTLRQDSFYSAISETLSKTKKPKKPEEMIELPNKEKSYPQNSPSHLDKKTIHPESKRGDLRIFAAFSNVNWEDNNLQPALEHFGEVIRFQWNFYDQYKPSWHFSDKARMNHRMLEALRSAHKEKSIDLFFGYVSGRTVFPGVIRSIGEMGVPTLCLSLDDKAKFFGDLESTGYTGMVDIANAFTLCWTSTEDAINKYESVGAKALYLPSGANPDVFRPYDFPRDIDVSFIGQKYGRRISMIEEIRKRGIDVKTFGKGWESGEIPQEEMIKLYSRSKITLGFAEVAGSKDLFCLKGRDFEVPMSGGFYLTQYHPELEKWFEIGKEIECYRDIDDMVEKIRYYLVNPEDANRIREAGRQKSIKDHTWVGRFECAFEILGVYPVSHNKEQEDYKEPGFQYTEDWYDKVYHKGRFDLSMSFDEIERTRYLAYRNRCYSVLDSACDIILYLKGNNEKIKWLEVCCQLGMTAKWVADKFPFVSMHMFDFSESVVQWLTTNFPYDANIWKGRIENIQNNESEFERYFDFVTCIDVTEHLPEEVYFKAIDEIHRVLKPGGLLLLMQGVCKENPEHINIREESQFVQEFIERGFRYLRTFPYRHHLLERLSTAKFDETSVESQTAGLTCHKNEDQMVLNLLKQGEELYYDNNLEKAKDVFKEILSINPNHVKALNNLGVLAFQQGDLELAVTMFEQAYSIEQDYIESIENMGKCFEAKREYHKALKWFERALSLSKKSVEILNSIGNCYVQLEDLSNAKKAYLESLGLDNTQENIKELLRRLETTNKSVEYSNIMRNRGQKNNPESLININIDKKKEDQENIFSMLKINFSKTYYTLNSYNIDKFTTPLWNNFNAKIEKDLLPIPPFSFLRNSTIAWTMVTSGGDWIAQEIDFLEKRMGKDRLAKLLKEDFIGDPIIINSPYRTSANSIHHLYHLTIFSEETKRDLGDMSTVIEWGGGYGNMAKLFKRFNNKHTYTIIDTPLFSCLQWLYLSTIFGEDSVKILRNSEENIYKGKINLLPVCFSESIDLCADLFIATWSLSESSKYSQDYVKSENFFNAQHLLIAYQDRNDDLPDAERVGSAAENFGAIIKDIEFLPGNHYAFK